MTCSLRTGSMISESNTISQTGSGCRGGNEPQKFVPIQIAAGLQNQRKKMRNVIANHFVNYVFLQSAFKRRFKAQESHY